MRNRSIFGWWAAITIEKVQYNDTPDADCEIWKNTIVLKAEDSDEAYKTAISYGLKSDAINKNGYAIKPDAGSLKDVLVYCRFMTSFVKTVPR